MITLYLITKFMFFMFKVILWIVLLPFRILLAPFRMTKDLFDDVGSWFSL